MKYCINCGNILNDEGNFCDRCGHKVDVDSKKRKETFFGEIIKCPMCGEPIKSFNPKCNSCGFEFTSVNVTKSVKDFFDKLNELTRFYDEKICSINSNLETLELTMEKNKAIDNFILTYPVPNTKQDIMEFLVLAKNNKSISEAWKTKYKTIKDKADIVLGDDKDYLKMMNEKKKEEKIEDKTNRKNKFLKIFLPIILGVLCSCALFAIPIVVAKDNPDIYTGIDEEGEIDPDSARVGYSSSYFIDRNYLEAKALLEARGFYNFNLIPLQDLIIGVLETENSIESISINGYSNFKAKDIFKKDSMIVISYHSY